MKKYSKERENELFTFEYEAVAGVSGRVCARTEGEAKALVEQLHGYRVSSVSRTMEPANENLYVAYRDTGMVAFAKYAYSADNMDFWNVLQPGQKPLQRVLQEHQALKVDRQMPLLVTYTQDSPYITPIELSKIFFVM